MIEPEKPPVFLLDTTKNFFVFQQIADLVGSPVVPTLACPSTAAAPSVSGRSNGSVGSAVEHDEIRTRLQQVRKNDPNPRTGVGAATLAQRILNGEALGAAGQRDDAIQQAVSLVAFLCPRATIEHLLGTLAPSLKATEDLAPVDVPAIDNARQKLQRALTKSRTEDDADAAALRGLLKNAKTNGAVHKPTGAYSSAELDSFCESLDVDRETLTRRWIIQHDSAFYTFVEGKYIGPISEQALLTSITDDLARAPIDHSTWQQGRPRPKNKAEYLHDYGTAAHSTIADMTLDASYYDHSTRTFHEAVCQQRPLVPKFNEQIHTWMTLLGGDSANLLLDWVATLTQLDRQTCALYLSGNPDDGKTVFVKGLAKIWTEGAPTELGRIVENFNADLLKCPLVFADEKLPRALRREDASSILRQLIAEGSRTVSRKFMPNINLVGSIRLVLAANNERMLSFDDDLGNADMAAVAGRFLHVRTSSEAGEYLKSLGGRNGIDGWIESDMIAAHALYLAETRQVQPGSRFLVEGRATEMHRMLATQSRVGGLCCEWLARYLIDPAVNVNQSTDIVVGGGKLLVNANAILRHWDTYISSDDVPNLQRIGRTLGNWSKNTLRWPDKNGKRYHEIPPDLVLTWAEQQHLGDPSTMRARINAPLEYEGRISEEFDS